VRKSLILRAQHRSTAAAMRRLYLDWSRSVDVKRTRMPRFVTLNDAWMAWDDPAPATEVAVLDQSRELEKFLAEIERRAFRMAQVALRDPDDALDVVQDAMLKLARNYAAKPSAEWRPLFYRILENGIRDLQRRRSVRKRFMAWMPGPRQDPDEEALDPLDSVADSAPAVPDQLIQGQAMQHLETSLRALPARQREAFMLRNFEGLDVAATAAAMGCSQGSVKTHYSRAVHTLRERLGEVW
jgi:RNA polymerase sigma-70 factor (ECF subfamily)